MTIRTGEPVEERSFSGPPAMRTVKSVCADCNNGWMSALEVKASPFLLTMIRGNTRVYYEAGQMAIATWLVKTALIAGSRFKPALPSNFYTEFYAERQPSITTRVWLAAAPYTEHHQSDFRPIRVQKEGADPPVVPNAFSSMIVVGQMVGFAVSWLDAVPSTERLLRDFGPALVPIWPPAREIEWPPRGGRLDFKHLDALADSIVSVADVQGGSGRPNA